MPKMQVYLPDDLYRAIKDLGLGASSLLQDAVRDELRRRQSEAQAWAWVHEVEAANGPPSDEELEDARRWVADLAEPTNAAPS